MRTRGHEITHNLEEDVVLFTSESVAIRLQQVFIELPFPAQMNNLNLLYGTHINGRVPHVGGSTADGVSGEECILRVLTVDVLKRSCKCHLSAVLCIAHAVR